MDQRHPSREISDLDNDEFAIEAVHLDTALALTTAPAGRYTSTRAIEKPLHASTRGDNHIGLDIDEQAWLTTRGNSATSENPRALQTTIEISAVYVYDGRLAGNRSVG